MLTSRYLFIYTCSRSFTPLGDLPPRAYETVHWATFIPHLGISFTFAMYVIIIEKLVPYYVL